MHYDVFNGDADGICALHQLRLAEPQPDAQLVTGVKRDIKLLERLVGKVEPGDRITALDISLDANREALVRLLGNGCLVFYADHHYVGDLPVFSSLTAHVNPDPDICTALIVDQLLAGRYRSWAVTAAFGDNLHQAADKAAAPLGLTRQKLAALRELGELLNYNGYGGETADLHCHPEDLYRALHPFEDPLDFYYNSAMTLQLRQGFADDMAKGVSLPPYQQNDAGRIYMFPAEPWGKRVAGVFSNEKAREMPDRAHALLVDNGDETLLVSVRAPLNNKKGADLLCRAFPTGGGRAGAAGINALPAPMIDQFVDKFIEVFS